MTAEKILDWARAQLGAKERPAGSNKVKYNTDYYGRAVSGAAYPWCMAFVWDGFRLCGMSALLYGVKTAYCPEMVNAFRARGAWVTGGFRPGDVVFYDWDGDGVADHVGIVERATAGGVTAIEGNTAVGNDSNGGEVLRRTRANNVILGAGRPRYEEKTDLTKQEVQAIVREELAKSRELYDAIEDCPAWARETVQRLVDKGIIQGEDAGRLGLTYDTLRILVINDRAGVYE